MRSATGLLPSSLAAPRLSPRLWLAIAAGIGCGACAYAGLYPPFDDGSLRIIIATTSVPFGAAVVATALGARTAAKAFGLTLLLAAVLGAVSIILPAAILTRNDSSGFVVACMLGGIFGTITGALYGLPLAVLSALGHRHVRVQTHESTDRAARTGGAWLFFIALIALLGTLTFDGSTIFARADPLPPSLGPAMVACAVALASLAVVVRSFVRLRARSAWLERVRSGLEPAYRLRPAEGRDPLDTLPRLGEGVTVVEWLPDQIGAATSGTAYRAAASGVAIAVVRDERAATYGSAPFM